ncbi:MAG: NAD(P)-binding domain-containing protein, partial [Betaproteobacteria bacterium]
MNAKTYDPCPPHRVAFLGLGVMGYPMAAHLARAGHHVTVYNRTAKKAERWAEEYGGRTAATPREAATGAQIVFACVGNDDDLRSVTLGADGAFAAMAADSIFVDHTTASAAVTREVSVEARMEETEAETFDDAFRADGHFAQFPLPAWDEPEEALNQAQ